MPFEVILMKRVKHSLKLPDSIREHSHGNGSAANRYEYEFHHGQVWEKLSAGKTELSAGRSLRNFHGVFSGISPLNKGFSREGWRLKAVSTTKVVAGPLVPRALPIVSMAVSAHSNHEIIEHSGNATVMVYRKRFIERKKEDIPMKYAG